MEYGVLFKISDILKLDIENLSNRIIKYNTDLENLKKGINSINNIITNKKNKYINSDSLNVLSSLINKNYLQIEFDEVNFAKILGGYLLLPNNPKMKEELDSLLNPIIKQLEEKIVMCKSFIFINSNTLRIFNSLDVSLNNLINEGMTIGGPTLNELLSYILNTSNNRLTEDEKLDAAYIINIVNLQALRRKEGLVNNASSSNEIKSLLKFNFEKEYANEFEEVNKLVDLYQRLLAKMNDATKNQILTISQDPDLNMEILNEESLNKLAGRIEDIKASFTADEYIRLSYLKEIFDWFNIYNSCNKEGEYQEIFKELLVLVEKYQYYIESVVDQEEIQKEEINNIIYLQEDNDIVGIDWINKDRYEYNATDYSALFRGIKVIKTSDRNYLLEETEKSKGAGIPGITEEKFRRLRRGNIRIIFMDINNLIDPSFSDLIPNDYKCYLVINFGKKTDRHELYDSLISTKSLRIPNLIMGFRSYLNESIKSVVEMPLSQEEKEVKVKELLDNLVVSSNMLFEEQISNAKGFNRLKDENNNTNENGGLKNA